jgi:hypothetical protein
MGLDPALRAALGAPYRPGSGRPPPRAPFATIKAAVRGPITAAGLQDDPAYRLACELFHSGYDWETHEILESLWLAATPNSRERAYLQALIQLANLWLKLTMGHLKAADRLRVEVANHLRQADGLEGLPVASLEAHLRDLADVLEGRRTAAVERPALA